MIIVKMHNDVPVVSVDDKKMKRRLTFHPGAMLWSLLGRRSSGSLGTQTRSPGGAISILNPLPWGGTTIWSPWPASPPRWPAPAPPPPQSSPWASWRGGQAGSGQEVRPWLQLGGHWGQREGGRSTDAHRLFSWSTIINPPEPFQFLEYHYMAGGVDWILTIKARQISLLCSFSFVMEHNKYRQVE